MSEGLKRHHDGRMIAPWYRACLDQYGSDFGVRRRHQCSETTVVLGIDVGSLGNQCLHNIEVAE
jgi:hypothetical protein